MSQRVLTIALSVGLCFAVVSLGLGVAAWRLPDIERGYSPKQPLDYSHRLHAGELQIDCRFCHVGAEQSRYAGIPSNDVCMKCHQVVTSSFDVLQNELKQADAEKRKPQQITSPELKKLYDWMGVDENRLPRKDSKPQSIPWVRIHDLPDHVTFDHRAHVTAGVTCQRCHGPVESMERVRQEESLSMGWCVNCHREVNKKGIEGHSVHASTNCSVCHH